MLLKTITVVTLLLMPNMSQALRIPLPPAELRGDSIECESYYTSMRSLYNHHKIEHGEFVNEDTYMLGLMGPDARYPWKRVFSLFEQSLENVHYTVKPLGVCHASKDGNVLYMWLYFYIPKKIA